GLEETVNLLEEQAERLEGAQQQDLLDQVVPLRERLTSLRSLAEVRATHGDSAVDAVLSREEALLAWQEARLTTLLNDPAESGEGQAGGRRSALRGARFPWLVSGKRNFTEAEGATADDEPELGAVGRWESCAALRQERR